MSEGVEKTGLLAQTSSGVTRKGAQPRPSMRAIVQPTASRVNPKTIENVLNRVDPAHHD
jgi:hypothetical protein